MRIGISLRHSVALVALIGACSGDRAMRPGNRELLPRSLMFEAEASGTDEGLEITCSVNFVFTLNERVETLSGLTKQFGEGGGDAQRSVARPNGTVVAFWADAFYPDLEFHLIHGDSIEIHSPLAEADTESRFWHELGRFNGRAEADQASGLLATGTWKCMPMDTPPSSGEYYDPIGTVNGTWRLRTSN